MRFATRLDWLAKCPMKVGRVPPVQQTHSLSSTGSQVDVGQTLYLHSQ